MADPTYLYAIIDHVEGPELPPVRCAECGNLARVLKCTITEWSEEWLDQASIHNLRPLCLVHAKHDRLFRRRVYHLAELRKEHKR